MPAIWILPWNRHTIFRLVEESSCKKPLLLLYFIFSIYSGGWMICPIFRIFKSILFFCQLNFIVLFPFFKKYYHILVIIVFWLGCDRPSGHLFFRARFAFFPYSRLSSYLFRLFLYLISFLLFPCASVWENTRAWVPHFLQPYWMIPFFALWRQWIIGNGALLNKSYYYYFQYLLFLFINKYFIIRVSKMTFLCYSRYSSSSE